MGKICCIDSCKTRDKFGIPSHTVASLHRFPEDYDNLTVWKEFCRKHGTVFKGKLDHRRICSRHFDASCFKDPFDFTKGLNKGAVPTLLEGEPLNGVEYLEIYREQIEQSVQPKKVQNEANTEIDYRVKYEAELKNVQELQCKLLNERKINRNVLRLCKRRKESLIKKKQQIIKLNNEIKRKTKLSRDDKYILQTVKSNPVLLESIKNLNRNKHGRRYKFAKKFATRQRLVSTAGYKKLRSANVLCLPHPKTINKWHQDISISPGFNEEILHRMRIAGETMSDKDKVVSILIDGMALKPMLDYHARTDRFHGLPTVSDKTVLCNLSFRL